MARHLLEQHLLGGKRNREEGSGSVAALAAHQELGLAAAPDCSCLADFLGRCPPDMPGIIAEFLWGFSECDRILEKGVVTRTRSMFPELGRLVCTGQEIGVLVLVGR